MQAIQYSEKGTQKHPERARAKVYQTFSQPLELAGSQEVLQLGDCQQNLQPQLPHLSVAQRAVLAERQGLSPDRELLQQGGDALEWSHSWW